MSLPVYKLSQKWGELGELKDKIESVEMKEIRGKCRRKGYQRIRLIKFLIVDALIFCGDKGSDDI